MRIVILFCLFSLAGCSPRWGGPLFQAYDDYRRAISADGQPRTAARYFSLRLYEGKDLDTPELKAQLLFGQRMVTIRDHIERSGAPRDGCLTVNGYDGEHLPIAFNIAYTLSAGRYLIDDVNLLYMKSEADFDRVARCPWEI